MRYLTGRIGIFSLSVALTTAVYSGTSDEAGDKGLKSEEARVGYSMGYKMGESIKKTELNLPIDPFMRGVRDALTDADSLIAEEEMREIRQAYVQKRQEAFEKEQKEMPERNLKAGREFLAKNAEKEGVVVLPSGLQYRIIESGDGKQPKVKDKVSIHYRGTLIDGTEIGNTYGREVPFSFRLETAIPGHLEALQLMREGDKWELFVPTELAYGEQGRRGLIEPNVALIFEVKLVAVEEADGKPAMDPAQSVEAAAEKSN